MTTAAQVKKLVKPLLARHPDLVLNGRWLYLKPVRHLLRHVYFDTTGVANEFEANWATIVLFRPARVIDDLRYGERMGGRNGWRWLWDDREMPAEFYDTFENTVLPALRAIETIDDFAAYSSEEARFPLQTMPAFPYLKLPIDIARGDLATARAICLKWRDKPARWPGDPLPRIVDDLWPMLERNQVPELIQQLHAWEASTVKQLKLDQIWAPSLFPIETMKVKA